MLQARFFYRTESGEQWPDSQGNPTERRRLTFAYTYDQDSGQVRFGSSVHRDVDPSQSYRKVSHRNTAFGRLIRCPRTIKVAPGTRYSDVEGEIRSAMKAGGARGDRLNNSLPYEIVENKDTITYYVGE